MGLSKYQQWKTYKCKSCESTFEGRVVLLGAFDEFYIEQLERKTYPNMCPVCGHWQDSPQGD